MSGQKMNQVGKISSQSVLREFGQVGIWIVGRRKTRQEYRPLILDIRGERGGEQSQL